MLRRFPGQKGEDSQGQKIVGDLAVISTDASGTVGARLELKDGLDSVAKPALGK